MLKLGISIMVNVLQQVGYAKFIVGNMVWKQTSMVIIKPFAGPEGHPIEMLPKI